MFPYKAVEAAEAAEAPETIIEPIPGVLVAVVLAVILTAISL